MNKLETKQLLFENFTLMPSGLYNQNVNDLEKIGTSDVASDNYHSTKNAFSSFKHSIYEEELVAMFERLTISE